MRILLLLSTLAALGTLSSCSCSNCPSYDPYYLDDVDVTTRHSFQ